MIDEALDPTTHDVAYNGYDCGIVSGIDQVRQNLKLRLLLIRGEWFLNSQIGLPLFEEILVKNPDLSAIDVLIKATILETPEVAEILSYSSTLDRVNRKLSISFIAMSIYGALSPLNVEI